MVRAFVLLNAEIGFENNVLKNLLSIDEIKEAHPLIGEYDIICKIKINSKLKDVIQKIRALANVRTMSTMIVVKGSSK
ncbi:MAG: Lrp/AsnC ligand binding domain-containing protein [Candidatus Hermodarchaeota archaeon]